jgi:serine/threonine protein phosphatase 1
VAVVGDIHGCLEGLDELIDRLEGMPLFFVGDLVDRGPDSRGVVQRMIDVGARGVRGNHEEWFAAWAAGEAPAAQAIPMFGEATLRSYGVAESELPRQGSGLDFVPAAHRDFVCALPLVMDLRVDDEDYWLVHAGVPRESKLSDFLDRSEEPPDNLDDVMQWLAEHRRDSLLWMKTLPQDMKAVDRPVIFGHTSFERPVDLGHVVALDTGAGRWEDAMLTAIVLPERRFVQVPAR